jgi:hypothetical protein
MASRISMAQLDKLIPPPPTTIIADVDAPPGGFPLAQPQPLPRAAFGAGLSIFAFVFFFSYSALINTCSLCRTRAVKMDKKLSESGVQATIDRYMATTAAAASGCEINGIKRSKVCLVSD